jgi:ribose-phosphate pyrophosphokinase
MALGLFFFEESARPARALAQALGIPAKPIAVHRFPDGESLVRVPSPIDANSALLYRSLDHPNEKLVEILLAASALRGNGARRIALVAPYLGYMRQDIAFNAGEAVSQRVIAGLLAEHFVALFTIDPHLHRIHSLSQIMPATEAVSLTAGPLLSAAIDPSDGPVLVGPDGESRQWVERIAAPLGLDVLVGKKVRTGDRNVSIAIDGISAVKGKRAILVDDVISSGVTLQVAAKLLHEAGAEPVEALATHCLASEDDLAGLADAGIASIRASDSVPGPVACLPTAGLLAEAIADSRFSAEN